MTRIRIQKITQSDVPSVIKNVYSKDVWDCFIHERYNPEIKIPITINTDREWFDTCSVPLHEVIGYVSKLTDSYIIADIPDYIERNKDIRKILDQVNYGKIKAYQAYIGKGESGFDGYRHIKNIDRILYFYLGNADPHKYVDLKSTINKKGGK